MDVEPLIQQWPREGDAGKCQWGRRHFEGLSFAPALIDWVR